MMACGEGFGGAQAGYIQVVHYLVHQMLKCVLEIVVTSFAAQSNENSGSMDLCHLLLSQQLHTDYPQHSTLVIVAIRQARTL